MCHVRSEAEREANIARNRALVAQLGISLDIPKAPKATPKKKSTAHRVLKRVKREREVAVPTRHSTRLRTTVPDPNESPGKKRKREVRKCSGLNTYQRDIT